MALDGGGSTDWATVTTQNAASDPSSAWAAALGGIALGVAIDRTLNTPQGVANSTGYGVNPDGTVYMLGQNTGQAGAAVPVRNNNMLLLLIVAAIVFAESR